MKPYSKDLRLRVLAACNHGMSRQGSLRDLRRLATHREALPEAASPDRGHRSQAAVGNLGVLYHERRIADDQGRKITRPEGPRAAPERAPLRALYAEHPGLGSEASNRRRRR